jgi:hypothetical protein
MTEEKNEKQKTEPQMPAQAGENKDGSANVVSADTLYAALRAKHATLLDLELRLHEALITIDKLKKKEG